ncbi:subtilase [Immersiella caudata]|uniref:Subtilase n=1 Tax=Immersiella caudata TaxID=314043 RepID=A0AA39WS75_9PEZI|nr:subtilase [Immersiella caudata]
MRLLTTVLLGLSWAVSAIAQDSRRLILEFEQGTDHSRLRSDLASRKGVKILQSFTSKVFSGVSLEAPFDSVESLQALPPVARAWKARTLQLESQPSPAKAQASSSPEYNIHGITNVDRVHALGILGKGAKVGVIDTGVDYTHPALGGCFGPECKIAGGYDFIGNSSYPVGNEPPMPDNDPADIRGHGTHVTGIIAGKSNFFTGVAPEATIYAYKVFGTENAVLEDDIIAAYLRAEQDGCDVITASIINYSGWEDEPWAAVGTRLVESGIIVVNAGGNYGATAGPFLHSTGASGKYVLSAASIDASQRAIPGFNATSTLPNNQSSKKNTTTTTTTYPYYFDAFNNYRPWPTPMFNVPVVPISLNTTDENQGCEPFPEGTKNFTGAEVVLARRGGCFDGDKQLNLEAIGARYILLYDPVEMSASPAGNAIGLLALIQWEAGVAMIGAIEAGRNVTASFDLGTYVAFADAAGGDPSSFTSWGALPDLKIKPDIAAPGKNILSTAIGGGYETRDGTSQAAPYIAGIAALWIGKYGGRSVHGPEFAKALSAKIIQSGNPVPAVSYGGNPWGGLASVLQVGNGVVDAIKVLTYNTTLSWVKFGLNDTAHFQPSQSVDITNKGNTEVTYNFGFAPSLGFELLIPFDSEAFDITPRVKGYGELQPVNMVPSVQVPGALVIGPGETKTATFTFDYPKGFSNLPAYSGKIYIGGNNGEVLTVPYFGIASDLRAELGGIFPRGPLPPSVQWPRIWLGSEYPFATIEEKPYFNFSLEDNARDCPKLHTFYSWGTHEVRWDIFTPNYTESQWTYPPMTGQNGYVGSATYWPARDHEEKFDPATDDANATFPFPDFFQYRNAPGLFHGDFSEYWWFGKLANGSQIAVGNYTMRYAALVPFGDPARSEDWDKRVWSFEVVPLV